MLYILIADNCFHDVKLLVCTGTAHVYARMPSILMQLSSVKI